MRELVDLIERECDLFEKLKESVIDQKVSMVERDIRGMMESLSRIERIALEIDEMDRMRNEKILELKSNLGLPRDSSIADVVNALEGEERERLLNVVSRFLRKVNELAVELEGMRDMLEFENAYFELLASLTRNGERKGTYSRSGDYRNVDTGRGFDTRW